MQEYEYGTGIGGVQVQLVKCSTDEVVYQKTSLPNVGNGRDSELKITDEPMAGHYSFPLDDVDPGRYYVM